MEDEGHAIQPSGKLLALVQDKLRQRELYARAGLPQPEFTQCDEPGAEAFEQFGYPLVQKARKGGYDGRGVAIIGGPEKLDSLLPVPSILERKVDLEKELAVVVARGLDGSIATYPLVEMDVDPEATETTPPADAGETPPEQATTENGDAEAATDTAELTAALVDAGPRRGVAHRHRCRRWRLDPDLRRRPQT